MMAPRQLSFSPAENLTDLMDDSGLKLLETSGLEVVRKVGIDVIRTIVLDVMSGQNLRNSTEPLTRYRLAALNAVAVRMLLKGLTEQEQFLEQLPAIAERILTRRILSKPERWVALWALGLTNKTYENVLRSDARLLSEYRKQYIAICKQVVQENTDEFGTLDGEIQLDGETITLLSWQFMVYLLGMVGAQTLTIRGSEKSAYGKLFGRLVLGSLLHILGFRYTGGPGPKRLGNEFWLSSQGEERESDATALWRAGRGARFDIGFIGPGNPEITLDKVTRFTREIELGRSKWYMATVIIVDRIRKGSRIKEIARTVDGDVVQMSMAYWPQEVAQVLNRRMGFEHPLVNMHYSEIHNYLVEAMRSVPLADYLP